MASHPDILVRPGGDTALVWTLAASALAHVAALGLLALAPQHFLDQPERVESYTVDLVAPSAIGGTNLIPGPGRGAKPLAVSKPPPAPAQAATADAPAVIPEQPRQPVEPPAKPEAPKQPEPPKQAEVAKAEEIKPVEAPKPPAPEVKKPAPEPAIAKKAEAAPPKVAPPADAKKQPDKPAPSAADKAKAAKPAQPPPKTETAARDQRIASAIQRRAEQLKSGESPKTENPIDRQIAGAIQNRMIAAAIQQRAEQLAREGGDGSPHAVPGPGGTLGYGPGTGPGGVTVGAEYILYFTHMIERIKAAWAWAGAGRALKAKVQFNITPAGDVVNVRIVEPSGDPSYDASVERAVRAANPLDPPPEKYRSEFASVELTFEPEDLRS